LPSGKFSKEFSNILQSEVIEQIKSYTFERRGGPVGAGEIIFMDSNGSVHSFEGESFFNSYDILTLIKYKKKIAVSC
jgi:hypothetical protein